MRSSVHATCYVEGSGSAKGEATRRKEETHVGIQSFRDCAPGLSEIFFAVLGEKSCKGRFLEKNAALVVRLGELVNFPLRKRVNQQERYDQDFFFLLSPTLRV
jgi:hypothetical protein